MNVWLSILADLENGNTNRIKNKNGFESEK